ncbi:MAG: tetrahydromethanopterin S-methyltransferase subunit E [Methanosphaera sp.]|nr:tetrahydromethanopterin S-methyltransferase subunit E [Methanosphaera sp.]
MSVIMNLCLVATMGLLAIITGIFEDLESDVASTSNPNSQVQLAPQVGNRHKLFNRAISGEPLLVGTISAISGTISYVFISMNYSVILSLLVASIIAMIIQVVLSITAYMGRITSQALYNQPLFMDVILKHIPTSAAHSFISIFSITLLSYILCYMITPTFAITLPIATLLMGITLGSIGSAVGDIHYGAEKLYQHHTFGSGIAVSNNGDITTVDSIGSRNSIDIVRFASKFASPLSGLCFGIIIFLTFWIYIVFGITGGLIAGLIIVLLALICNCLLESHARNKYGSYNEETRK